MSGPPPAMYNSAPAYNPIGSIVEVFPHCSRHAFAGKKCTVLYLPFRKPMVLLEPICIAVEES